MKKYKGEIFWITGNYKESNTFASSKAIVNRAILDENVFRIDHQNPNNFPDGEIKLRTQDGFNFDGAFKYIDEKLWNVKVNTQMYANKKNVLLIGNWIEDSTIFNCIIELVEVKEF